MAGLFDKIKKILIDEFDVDEAIIQPSSSFTDDLNMDADDLAEFFTIIEDRFSTPGNKFEIPDDESDNIVNVQDMIEYLQDKGIDD
jgi:acyl carrier protein